MPRPPVALVTLITSSLLAACQTDQPVQTGCLELHELERSMVERLDRDARAALESARAMDIEALWSQAHPSFQGKVQQDQLAPVVEQLSQRLNASPHLVLREIRLIDTDATQPAVMACGPDDPSSPDRSAVAVSGLSPRLALVSYRAPGEPQGWTYNVELWPAGDGWAMAHLEFQTYSYRGEPAASWASKGELALAAGEILTAGWTLQLAAVLANAGDTLQTPQQVEILNRLQAVQANAAYQALQQSWPVEGGPRAIHRMGIEATRDAMIPTVAFITDGPLDEDAVRAAAAPLVAWLQQTNPSVVSALGPVAFTAYSEPPLDPRRQYRAFTVMLPDSEPGS